MRGAHGHLQPKSPLLREMRETADQFRAPFVIDSSRFDAAFGRLEPTPHSEAVRMRW